MRSQHSFILLIAVVAVVASCRRGGPETASQSEPFDLRGCVRKQLQVEGFRIELPYPNIMSATTGPVGSLNDTWKVQFALPDGSVVDRVTVWLGERAVGETVVRDRADGASNGWRRVPTSARVNRTIENVNKLCPVPVGTDTTGSR